MLRVVSLCLVSLVLLLGSPLGLGAAEFRSAWPADASRAMGIAYGAAEPGSTGNAARIGVIIDPEGIVKAFYPRASTRNFPGQALEIVRS